jgi:RNA polymerase sigma-70 factor (ECF subfamily)
MNDDTAMAEGGRAFHPTLWTLILRAKASDGPERRTALESLIGLYWRPLYWFVRRKGNPAESAKDLVQGFFTALLEKNYLQYVDRGRGKFRSFLLTALDHYIADEWDKAHAQKRGGAASFVTLDFDRADAELLRDPAARDPDLAFARDWALRVMAEGLRRVRDEFARDGRGAEFEALRLHLSYGAGTPPTYLEVAERLGLGENDVRTLIHRTRRRYREAVLDVLRDSAESEAEAQEELRELLAALS